MVLNKNPSINFFDIDVGTVDNPTNIGSGGATFTSSTFQVDGPIELSGTIQSASSAAFNVKVRWLNPDGDIRRTQEPPALQGVTDINEFLLVVKASRFVLLVEDASNSVTNNIHGSVNTH